MGGLNVTLLIAVAIIAVDAYKNEHDLPLPQRFLWAVAIWSILGLVAAVGAEAIAAVFGFGLVLAMSYRYFTGGGTIIGGTSTGSREGPSSLPQPKAS